MNKRLEAVMADLHTELAERLLERIRDGEAKASDLNVARQFLKDNGIDGVPTAGNPLDNLVHSLPDFADDELPLQ